MSPKRAPGESALTIRLTDLRVPISIGWTELERRAPQPIRFDLEIALPAPPAATVSDELADTIDYAALAELIRRTAAEEPVRLLERLAAKVADAVRGALPGGARLRLVVTKQLPELTGGHGSASIELIVGGDLAE
ncbi:MAG: dihydroneopterin aldolase [Gemmatimonadales bacterium]